MLKTLLHLLHLKGFSPVCFLIRTFKRLALIKALVHSVQMKGFSPVCILIWMFKSPDVKNDLLHSVQQNCYSPVWYLICTLKLYFVKNPFFTYNMNKLFLTNVHFTMRVQTLGCSKGFSTLQTSVQYCSSLLWIFFKCLFKWSFLLEFLTNMTIKIFIWEFISEWNLECWYKKELFFVINRKCGLARNLTIDQNIPRLKPSMRYEKKIFTVVMILTNPSLDKMDPHKKSQYLTTRRGKIVTAISISLLTPTKVSLFVWFCNQQRSQKALPSLVFFVSLK